MPRYLPCIPVLLLLLLNLACTRKECCNFPTVKDFMIADKDARSWSATSFEGSTFKQDSLFVSAINNDSKDRLSFKIGYTQLGYYELKAGEASYTITGPGGTSANYQVSPTFASAIAVVSYNKADHILQGFFDLKFVRISGAGTPGQPDSTAFLNGKFKVSLHN